MSTRLDLSKLTLMDALDLASIIELEAKRRYTEFAESLGSRGTDDAGAVFRSMAINETKHCEEIAERRLALALVLTGHRSAPRAATGRCAGSGGSAPVL
jgi:rubrerythrin